MTNSEALLRAFCIVPPEANMTCGCGDYNCRLCFGVQKWQDPDPEVFLGNAHQDKAFLTHWPDSIFSLKARGRWERYMGKPFGGKINESQK